MLEENGLRVLETEKYLASSPHFQSFDDALGDEFDDYIESIINKHTYTLEDLTKDEYRKLIIDYLVHLQMEKMQLNPLEMAANHEIHTRDVKRLFSKLQYAPQKSDKVALLLEELYDIPPGIARLVARNICLYIPKVL